MTDVLSTLELPLLERLRSQLRSFSPAERRVADTILRDPLGIIHLSVSELATLAETSAATVVRLCTSIGLRGYQELKITLATQSIPSEKRVLDAVDSGDDVRTVSQKVLAGTAAAVEATAAVLDTGELERIAEAILGASRIQFGAVGTSAPLAQDAAYRLTTIGIPATFISPPGTPAATSTPSSRRTPATPSGPSWRNRTRGVWAPTSPTSSRAPSSSPTAADGPPRPPPTGSPHISTEQSAHRPPHSLLGVRWPHPLLFGVHMLGIVSTPDGTAIADVAVSNGRDVVLTDADGRFELPAATPFVTVTVPAGYSTGTWWLPASDDTQLAFVLEPREQTLPYEFIHLTDTHLTIPTVEAVNSGLYSEGSIPSELTAFLSSLPDRAPAAQAIFVTGDLADHGIAEEFEAFSDAVANSPLPMRVVPGNHDHMNGTHGSIISRNNYLTNTGDPALYERMIGPRWYSFDIPGLHVVAMDWHSHETGHDHDLQNAWLNADLAVREPGSPWMLLFHDQPGSSLLEHAPWHPIAAFSGHWHTSRVVRVDGTLHVNSPTTFFAGLDYSPPAYRRVIWDGEQITLHTETVTIVPDPAPLGDTSRATFAPAGHDTPADDAIVWRAQLHGAGHRQNVTVDGEIVFAGAQIEDEPLGFVEALDLATGTPVWTTEVESAVKTAPVVWGDTVIAATVSGDVHGLDRTTGERRWILPSSDPLRRFAWNAPTVHDGVIYIGDQADLRAIDAATGDVLWRRTDIAPHHNLVNHSRPLIIDDLLVMGFWPTPQHPVGLNRHTGESVWATGDNSGELFTALKALLIMGTATYDAAEDAVLMPAFAHTARVDRETGAIEWVTAHPGAFSPASPIVTPSGYVVTATGHGLLMLDPTTGDIRWDREITGEAPFPMRSYSKAPHPVIAPPTPIADRLVLPGLDGLIRVFDLDGNLLGQSQIGSPLAAELTVAGDLLLTVGTDGIVIALSTPALLARATNNSDAHAEVSA